MNFAMVIGQGIDRNIDNQNVRLKRRHSQNVYVILVMYLT